uniref:DNA polymerase III subunit delta' n=1 Tax=uncultured Chloroflexota bacterium TaxID=166587 RepID=H5SAM4_9CHLR|nr:DNA polymerase III subunit delta' [uncultured Chloroflexota bacterium]BAL54776.1 DNA polymerase III subunit delta' [uncultured Chloroflexota bacterium]
MENWNILGHEWAVELLREQVARQTLRHAYLFSGPGGIGKRTLALRLAQAVSCSAPPAPGVPCGRCRNCRQIEAGNHPDLLIVQSERVGGILKVEAVREARRLLNLKPFQSPFRVVLFLRFQEANESASNALLKTLEEAPPHALLILTAESPEQVLPTIPSRCEILRLRPLPLSLVEEFLKGHGVEEEKARLLAHLSQGRPGYALRLAQEPQALQARQQRLTELHHLLHASRIERFAYAENLARDREQLRETFLLWISYWRDVYLRAMQADSPVVHLDRLMDIEFLAGQLSGERLYELLKRLERAIYRLDIGVNPRLLTESILLFWPQLEQ